MNIEEYTKSNCENFLVLSDVPVICKSKPCLLGIDEAGRGPVLGPMVYAIAYCPIEKNSSLESLGVDDSKVLTESQREALFMKLIDKSTAEYIGWAAHLLSPRYISSSMYKRVAYNLNDISHDTAIGLIHTVIARGVAVQEVYVDTVGPPEKYQEKLESVFPDLKITVAKKADSLYPCVSAASICAKVARDKALADWIFSETLDEETSLSFSKEWGSGYPVDPLTKQFLRDNVDSVFGFPTIVRFSWSTAEKILSTKAHEVEFEEVDPQEDPRLVKNPSITEFFSKSSTLITKSRVIDKERKTEKRPRYFRERKLTTTTMNNFLGTH